MLVVRVRRELYVIRGVPIERIRVSEGSLFIAVIDNVPALVPRLTPSANDATSFAELQTDRDVYRGASLQRPRQIANTLKRRWFSQRAAGSPKMIGGSASVNYPNTSGLVRRQKPEA